MKKLWTLIRQYSECSIALLATLIALGLAAGGLWTIAHWALGLVAVGLSLPLVWNMIEDIRTGTYGVDVLAVTAILTSVVMHQFWAGIVIVLMLTGGEALEDYAETRAKVELDALLSRAPKQAHIYRGRKVIDVAVSEVQIGTKLVIRPGEVVPVDATVVEGNANMDESSLTGESLPQLKGAGDTILSGSINTDSPIIVKALHSAADSQYEQIIHLVKAARSSQAPFVRLADRYSIPFTVVSFLIAGGAWIISHQSIRFLEVLVVATPCPLILAAPIAIISGMSRSAKHGIIVKTGGTLERLAAVRTFAFDKTGTLTKGELTVDHIQTFGTYTTGDILSIAAGLEQDSNHVLAQAIIAKARDKQLRPVKAKKVRELAGAGLSAVVDRQQVLVGRASLLQKYDVKTPATLALKTLQQTAAFVAIDGTLAGIITFKDELRPNSKQTLQRLRTLGVEHFLMVTGDNESVAAAVAKTLSITDVRAGALPGDKIHAIEQLRADQRPVAFVGDGVNDAPVLTASDVGIALGARGSTAASESADMVIMLDDISRVAQALEIARRTFFIARQSILVGIALSIILMCIFATGRFRPLYGAIIQEGVDVIVIFNALRAHGRFGPSKTAA
jgi:heavy metal translocating P-type ATPase